MKERGQWFFLDFLIATSVVFLAIALIVQQTELHSYNTKQYAQQTELQRIGENAFNALTHDANIVCTLVVNGGADAGTPNATGEDDPVIGPLPYCLGLSNKPPPANPLGFAYGLWKKKQAYVIDKNTLGIPKHYACEISTSFDPASGSARQKRIITECCAGGANNLIVSPASSGECNSLFTANNVYSKTTRVVFYNSPQSNNKGDTTIEKAQLDACMGFLQQTAVVGGVLGPTGSRKCYPTSATIPDESGSIIELFDANFTLKVWKP